MPTGFDSPARRQTFRDSAMGDLRDCLKRLCLSKLMMMKVHFQQRKQKDKEKLIDEELDRRKREAQEQLGGQPNG